MLDEYRQIYQENANLISDWKKLSKNDLANLYIEHENEEIANSYFSGLMLKFWNLISHYYYKQGVKSASEEDCYNWLITGITLALNKRVWKDPNNKLYNDPKGPEKAIMVCIMSDRANFYQYTKYDKRNLNYSSLSLNALEEISSDGFFMQYTDKYITLFDYIKDKIKKAFKEKDYLYAWFLDILFNFNLIVEKKEYNSYNISISKFNKCLKNIDLDYLKNFAYNYSLNFNEVKASYDNVINSPQYITHVNINNILNQLKKDDLLYSLLQEGI